MALTDPDHAAALDRDDPLAGLQSRFIDGDEAVVYMDGNSLGRLSLDAREAAATAVARWGRELVGGWHEWIDLPLQAGDELAEGFLGAAPGQTLVCDSVTVNLFKLAGAALAAAPQGRRAMVTDRSNFPTDRYVLAGLGELRLIAEATPAAVAEACAAGDVALVCLSHVDYRSAAVADVAAVARAAHEGGARLLLDCSHSAGAIAVELDRDDVDLAVGCTYKYLNAGPGAPAFLYVRRDAQERLRSPVQGWFGQRDQFAMERDYEPAEGIARFLAGTPTIVAIEIVRAALRPLAAAGIGPLHAKARALTAYAIELSDEWLAPLGVEVASPRDDARRGAHVALRHPAAWQVCRALIERRRVIPDFREPDVIRLGMPPAYTSFGQVHEALARLRDLLSDGEHLAVDARRLRVT